MQRRGVFVGVWVLVTALATLIAWAAVSQVTEEVSPQAVLALPRAATIADGSSPPRSSEGAQVPGGREEQPSEAVTVTEAYDLVGGVVTVRYRGMSAELVEASPDSGFVMDVHDPGPEKVDVRFRSDGHESRLVTRVRAGAPDPETEERPR